MKKLVSTAISASLVLSSLTCTAPALADPSSLRDLVGARGSSAESELSARGYALSNTIGSANMWWNDRSRTCVSVAVDNGRVASIQSASTNDCGKRASSSDAVAGIIAGAAAAGLIAALSGHHKHTDNRNNNAGYNSEFERGYNDAMYGSHYARNDSEAYHSGFMAGEAERSNRRHANSHIARGAPAAAGNACINKGESEWGVPPGSVSVVSNSEYAPGNFEIVLATGHWRARCLVTASGQVTKFRAN